MLQWLHLNNSHAYPFSKTTPGTISESCQQSCAIKSRQQFFRCSNCDQIFVSETRSKQSQNYSVSESEGAPFKVVHLQSEHNLTKTDPKMERCSLTDTHLLTYKGAWIAEWSSHSAFEHLYATPWAVSSSLGDGKLFFGPKHNIYALFIILFDLILLFVCQICHVNCEAEN